MKTAYLIAGLATVAAVGVGVYYMRKRAQARDVVEDVVESAATPSQLRTDELTRFLSPSARRVDVTTKQGTFSLPASFVRSRFAGYGPNVKDAATIF